MTLPLGAIAVVCELGLAPSDVAGRTPPQLAPVAMQSGTHVARQSPGPSWAEPRNRSD